MKKKIFVIILLIIIDIIIIKCWILYRTRPIPHEALYVVFISFYCFLANIFAYLLMIFIKKQFAMFFILNAFIFVFILWFIQSSINRSYMKSVFDTWEFYIGEDKYNIGYSTFKSLDSIYFHADFDSIYDITIQKYNGEWGYKNGRGTVQVKNDTVYFLSIDSCQYYIYGDTLYNFEGIDKIKVKKKY